ncbi:MAG: Maf family protein [Chloroflexota bacterium]
MKQSHTPLILASASPRRQAFLQMLNLKFTIQAADIDESPYIDEAPSQLVQRLSQEKARVIGLQHPNSVVIGADTIVVLGSQILGKPRDETQAYQMLSQLRGQNHDVYSAITFWKIHDQKRQTYLSQTTVTMRPYTDDEINTYISTGDPMDKAGAYAIQHVDFAPVAKLVGCYAGVVGLPLGYLVEGLSEFGVSVSNIGRKCAAITDQSCCQDSISNR